MTDDRKIEIVPVCHKCKRPIRLARDGFGIAQQVLEAKARAVKNGDDLKALAVEVIHARPLCADCWHDSR